MIYVSTGGLSNQPAFQTAQEFIDSGIFSIELSGGLHDKNQLSQLKRLQSRYNASFSVHNYFPPPANSFVLNLASLNPEIHKQSTNHVINSIRWSCELGNPIYSFHAGFLLDPSVAELGQQVEVKPLFSRQSALCNFIDTVNMLSSYANSLGVTLLIENNVLSNRNYLKFQGNPFLMATPDECEYVMRMTDPSVYLLVDVAHLNVSCNSLGLNRDSSLSQLTPWTKGYHLSDNNGLTDSNDPFAADSWFLSNIRRDLQYYSIEVYRQNATNLLSQYQLLRDFLVN